MSTHSLSTSLRRKRNPDDNLIPLINIVFLLLIFFMVAGQMRAQTAAELKLPISQQGEHASEIELRLELNANLETFWNGNAITELELAERLGETSPATKVTVFLHRHLTADQIQPFLTTLRQQRITHMTLISDSEG